jgi:hypothetical protein
MTAEATENERTIAINAFSEQGKQVIDQIQATPI